MSFEQAAYTIPEGTDKAIKVKLSADPERDVMIALEFTTELDGATDADYSLDDDPDANALTLTFEEGEEEQSFTFKSLTDNDEDDGETVTITFVDSMTSPLPDRVTEGTTNEAVVTIKPLPVTPPPGGGGGGGGGPPPAPVPSEADFEWNVTRDIEALDKDNDLPTDLWSDGQTIWVLNNAGSGADSIFAYDLATGERKATSEFTLDSRNRFSHGIWSDGDTVWVADSGQDLLFAYDLATGERRSDDDLKLHEDNRDPRGIWSDGDTIYVLDSVKDSLFAYDLESGTLIAQYSLHSLSRSPRGIWSDGVTIWISDDSAKRIFAYKIEDDGLTRIEGEEFSYQPLLKAGNGQPRGIWSDRDVVFVADEQDDRIYSYNMPETLNPTLASLSLSDANLGLFSSSQMKYTAVMANGATLTTVEAVPTIEDAKVSILPGDSDADPENGHQAKVEDGSQIKVMVTSADGSRTREYTVDLKQCLSGLDGQSFGPVHFMGGSLSDLEACARDLSYSAIYHDLDGVWTALFFGAPEFLNQPFRNRFANGIAAGEVLIGRRVLASASTGNAPASN